METLQVRINDTYAQTNFPIEVTCIAADAIKQAIEDKYESFRKHLERYGGGLIHVRNQHGKEVASGSIVWWLTGGHTIRIEQSKPSN